MLDPLNVISTILDHDGPDGMPLIRREVLAHKFMRAALVRKAHLSAPAVLSRASSSAQVSPHKNACEISL